MPFDRSGEDLGRRLERAQLQQVVPPIEQVLLGRVHVRSTLVLLRRGHEIAATLLDVAEKVVELARVFQGQRAGRLLACRGQFACLEQDEGEVVAVGVLRRVDRLRPLKMRKRRVHLAVA